MSDAEPRTVVVERDRLGEQHARGRAGAARGRIEDRGLHAGERRVDVLASPREQLEQRRTVELASDPAPA